MGTPYTVISTACQTKPNFVEIAAQNVHWEDTGAFTGEISASMLKDVGASYAIIGHSERRQYFGETDEGVKLRVKAAMAAGITPIVCIGEQLDDRKAGTTEQILKEQLGSVLSDIEVNTKLVIAYEPVWAIGTGLAATSEQAEEAHAFIRAEVADLWNQDSANKIRILYGGSMKPSNIAELMSQENVDGGLVGGASLKPEQFFEMIATAVRLD